MHMRFLFVLFLVNAFLLGGAFAQPDTVKVKVSKDKVKISGKLYYVHTVRSGETLYNIAKAYEVAQAAIIENNPELYKGIKIGNTIKIPAVQELKNPNSNKELYHVVKKGETLYGISKLYNVPVDELSKVNMLSNSQVQENQVLFITSNAKAKRESLNNAKVESALVVEKPAGAARQHLVQPKETIFSISKRYGVSKAELEEANPALKEKGLQEGATLAIPEKAKPDQQEVTFTAKPVKLAECPPYTYRSSTAFNVVLMLPLSIASSTADTTGADYRRYEDIMQYYEGTLVAIDSLKNHGVSVNLTVVDTKNDRDEDAIELALKNPALRNANLIIGPVYQAGITAVAAYAESKGIPMVSPLATSTSILKDNPYLIQIANEATVLNKHTLDLARNGVDSETILVIPAAEVDSKAVKSFKAALGEKHPEIIYTPGKNAASQREMLKGKMKPNGKNRFVVLSNSEVFVLDFLQNLSVASKDYSVEVLGNSRWLKFTSIDMQYIHGTNVEMYVNNFVDYSDDAAKEFVRKFRNYYKVEPNNYAFRGFDVAYFFIDALRMYGPDFITCLPSIKAHNIHTPFAFEKQGEKGGFLNIDAVLIRHIPGYAVKKIY